jgi:excisionase family DNA binding protein
LRYLSRENLVANEDPDRPEDPWLTLAEIAEELRVNPATVRQWVAKGRLEATRVGQRKLLVRRSELDRVLEGAGAPAASAEISAPSSATPAPRRPQFPVSELQPAEASVSAPVASGAVRDAIDSVRVADRAWESALTASELAPPDPGFAARVHAIADAAEREGSALLNAAINVGLRWSSRPGARGMRLSHELRPGGNRPGPPELWERFDAGIERLGIAMEGTELSAVAYAFTELSEVLRLIADELEKAGPGWALPQAG